MSAIPLDDHVYITDGAVTSVVVVYKPCFKHARSFHPVITMECLHLPTRLSSNTAIPIPGNLVG